MSLKGKIAVITGGASGIGRATALSFLAAGVEGLTLVDLSASGLDAFVSGLPDKDKERVITVAADVTREASVEDYIARTIEKWGRLDVSVQAAGILHGPASVGETEEATYSRVFDVNVKGTFLGLKHSSRAILQSPNKRRGSIVLISSEAGIDGCPLLSVYAASKFAVRGFALSAAAELGPQGIRVNAVSPGPTETPMIADLGPPEIRAAILSKGMLKRIGQPEEVAAAILFLASDSSSLVTGSTLKVDGGASRFG